VFWVISVYFNLRNILLKSGTFLLGHPVYSQKFSQAGLEPGLTMNVLLYHITNLVSCAAVQHTSVPSVPIRSSSYSELLFFDIKFLVQNQKADWLSTHM